MCGEAVTVTVTVTVDCRLYVSTLSLGCGMYAVTVLT